MNLSRANHMHLSGSALSADCVYHQLQVNDLWYPSRIATMGLRMDDIHMPTVEAGPTTRPTPLTTRNGAEPSLLDLMSERDRVESELKALGSVLESVGFT